MFQQFMIIGHLGKDPEMRYMPDGQAVTSFNIATNRKWTDPSGAKKEERLWVHVSVWGKQAESCNQYLKKGSLALVVGRLTPDPVTGGPRQWTDRDGATRANFDMKADNVRFLSSKEEAQVAAAVADAGAGNGNGTYGVPSDAGVAPDEDLIQF
jgi:single-strand DNA-binding protein